MISGQHAFNFTQQKPLLFSNQGSLPHLPVPPLDETLQRYLLSVKPLLEETEFQEYEKLVSSFKKKEGKKLQLYLNMKSWVSENYVPCPCSPERKKAR